MRGMSSGVRLVTGLLLCLVSARAQPEFDFHSGFWVNLHEFLKREASGPGPATSDGPAWRDAVEYYRREMLGLDELGDRAKALQWKLSEAEGADRPPTGLEAELANALTKAAPIYRRARWAEHDRANRKWIEAAQR